MRLLAVFCFLVCFHLCYCQEIPPDLLNKMEEAGQNKVFRDSLNKDKIFTSKKGGLIQQVLIHRLFKIGGFF